MSKLKMIKVNPVMIFTSVELELLKTGIVKLLYSIHYLVSRTKVLKNFPTLFLT